MKILKGTFALLHAVVAVLFIVAVSSVKYFSIGTVSRAAQVVILIFIIPILVDCFFIKSSKKSANNIVVLIMVNVFVLAGSIFYLVLFCLGGGLRSFTGNLEDYLIFDKRVETIIEDEKFAFPDMIPKQASDIEYYYEYVQTFNDEIKIRLSVCYTDMEYLKAEQARVTKQFNIVSIEKSNEIICYFIQKSDIINFVAFNMDKQKITYGYYAFVDENVAMQKLNE